MAKEYNRMIDHTLLKADAIKEEIDKLINEAKKYNFKTICINSAWIPYAKKLLAGTEVGITTVVGFPLGASFSSVKAFEASEAIKAGADEIDMVINIGKLKDKDYEYVLNDIKEVKKACKEHILKVIVETALLTKDEIEKVTEIVANSGAEFIKTSTGFSTRGASLEDVLIMQRIAHGRLLIKAAGGISNMNDMIEMNKAGATRFGTSRSIAILESKEIDPNSY
ncbi:Deoxyribose-phosphate aldolase [Mycoplasmopsis meleagridis]|uniref:Deoxyribose-phosphate aldolase n=1 Tax=Mycoplasmopsis meleagridis ATCC 25294 TaxID=1264554 RepID=A0A0F5H0W2_9BACT|nr:deoxyribose-phosphate aldolase [Mycoplasmopsis meleagridis]KKB26966.1 Deoxyribose-phosphate aldolase [Mycoplasmopsis meleagridis ATCC 25294]OAD18555.1 Deoxyribose-phosphate aldolase [Mycoplasmopsis meleagridis]VEU77576.1 deoxyribose-phosphate aldolase [Mycoplasmopsis meleagridis]